MYLELDHLAYHIQVWSPDGTKLRQTIAASQNISIAQAAIAAASVAYPSCRLQLREGLRLIEDREPKNDVRFHSICRNQSLKPR